MAIFLQDRLIQVGIFIIIFKEDENKQNKMHVTNERGGTMVIFLVFHGRSINSKDEFQDI